MLGVNTVLTTGNLQAAIQIGKQIESSGIDQWTLSPLLLPQNGRMEPVLSTEQLRGMIECVSETFAESTLEIIFDMDLPLLHGLVDDDAVFAHGDGRWRFEYALPGSSNILLEAGNPKPGHFFRMNHAAQLFTKEDYRWIGHTGSYGKYSSGKISGLLNELRKQRVPATCSA